MTALLAVFHSMPESTQTELNNRVSSVKLADIVSLIHMVTRTGKVSQSTKSLRVALSGKR